MNCSVCGRAVKGPFIRCYECHQKHVELMEYHRYTDMTPDKREAEREAYYSQECVMCGKEGAYERKDGKNYCSMCWTIWNS